MYILNDYSTDYKAPLMMQFEIKDILFFLRCIQNPTKAFDIHHYVEFCSGSTRSSTSFKLKHPISKPTTFFSIDCLDYGIPYL